MRPITLTVEGLRSFRSAVTIDFDGRDHVAIVGDTGAGKSSLLEAMTWALYGRTSWSGHPNQELMNDTSTHLRVVLRFRVRGQQWQVTRTLRRTGKGDVGSATVALVRDDGGDQPLELVGGVGPVRDRIVQLVGLDHDAFTRTVVLPQGQFAQLLLGEGDVPRADVLRQVWRLDELEAAGAAVAAALNDLHPMRARVEQALDGQPADPRAHHADLAAAAARTASDASAARSAKEALEAACRELADAQARIDLLDMIEPELSFDDESLTSRAAAVVALAQSLAGARATLVERRAALAADRTRLVADDDGLSAAEVASALTTLRTLPATARRLVEAAEAARAAAVDADAAREVARIAAERAEQAAAMVREREDQRPPVVAGVEAARERASAARHALAAVREARARADGVSVRAQHARAAAAAAAASVVDARRAAETAAAADADAQADLERARRDNAAAAAAHGLHAGDPCPVCARKLPAAWRAPDAAGLDAAVAAAQEAGGRSRAAADLVARGDAEAASAQAQASQLDEQAHAADGDAARAAADAAALLGATDLTLPDDELLAAPAAAAEAAAQALAEFDRALREVQEEAARQGAAAAATAATADGSERQSASAAAEAANARASLAECLRALPRGVDARVDVPPDPVDVTAVPLDGVAAAQAALEQRQAELDDRRRRREAIDEALREVDAELAAVDATVAGDVTAPAAGIRSAVARQRLVLERAAIRLDVQGLTLPDVGDDPALLAGIVAALAAATAATVEAARQARADAAAAAARAEAVVGQHRVPLGLAADAAPDEVAKVAAERWDEAQFVARTAREAADAFSRRVEPLERLRAVAADLEARCLALGDLSAALKPGAFPKWVTLRRSRALLAHASRLLGDMTAGRYAFADVDDANNEWRIVDNDTGTPRSPASLSGGEKFVASLALAFGMVEMMARSGGRLESLWLDEGFGALDRANLDAAVEALALLASGDRLVAVISHIRAVAEQMQHVLAVTRTATGSDARWLTPAERAEVAGADAAMAGLLD